MRNTKRLYPVVTAPGSVTSDRCAILDLARVWAAKVAELADAPDLGSGTERCGGSSPPFRTIDQRSEIGGQRSGQKSLEGTDGPPGCRPLNSDLRSLFL